MTSKVCFPAKRGNGLSQPEGKVKSLPNYRWVSDLLNDAFIVGKTEEALLSVPRDMIGVVLRQLHTQTRDGRIRRIVQAGQARYVPVAGGPL
jgi:hypothetical protein